MTRREQQAHRPEKMSIDFGDKNFLRLKLYGTQIVLGKSIFLLLLLFMGTFVYGAGIDNSGLIPGIVADTEVKLEPVSGKSPASPDWVKSLIIAEVNVESASAAGNFSGMNKVLDHLAETGVNGIWLTPINKGHQYGNYGVHTLNPTLTNRNKVEESWQCVKGFVDAAHRRNIRVFFDVVSWGVTKAAPLHQEKPEWFTGPSRPGWNGWMWNWKNPELNEWFASRLVEFILLTGADGFRADCAPACAGYAPYRIARERLLSFGRKIVLFAENASEREKTFDFDQNAFIGPNKKPRMNGDVFLQKNIVNMVKNGEDLGWIDGTGIDPKSARDNSGSERFYALSLSCHDSKAYTAKGSPIAFGYAMIFAPFIPIWYIGEEWNNPYSRKIPPYWLFANKIDWQFLERNRDFYEQVKRMIRIRRQYPEIFEYFPADHRKINLCKVQTDHPELLQAYARFRNKSAILIVPNNGESAAKFRITINYEDTRIGKDPVIVTDLLGEKQLASGRPETFEVTIPAGMLGAYLVRSEK